MEYFSYLSSNLVTIINWMLEEEDLVKLVNYNDLPLDKDVLASPQDLVGVKVFPHPSPTIITEESTRIHVYYPEVEVNTKIEQTRVCFDLICSNSLYLYKQSGISYLRLFEIANRITKQFDLSVDKVGILNFKSARVFPVGINFQGLKLTAIMMTIGGII